MRPDEVPLFPKRKLLREFVEDEVRPLGRGAQTVFSERLWIPEDKVEDVTNDNYSLIAAQPGSRLSKLIGNDLTQTHCQSLRWFSNAADVMNEYPGVAHIEVSNLFWSPESNWRVALKYLSQNRDRFVLPDSSWTFETESFSAMQNAFWEILKHTYVFKEKGNVKAACFPRVGERKNCRFNPCTARVILQAACWLACMSYSMEPDGLACRRWLGPLCNQLVGYLRQENSVSRREDSPVLSDLHHNHAFSVPCTDPLWPAFEKWNCSPTDAGEVLAGFLFARLQAEIASTFDSRYEQSVYMNQLSFATGVFQCDPKSIAPRWHERARSFLHELEKQFDNGEIQLDVGHLMSAKIALAKRDGLPKREELAAEGMLEAYASPKNVFESERKITAESALFAYRKDEALRASSEKFLASKPHQMRDQHLLDFPRLRAAVKE